MAPPAEVTDKRQAAREVIDILHEIATLLVREQQPEHIYSTLVTNTSP